jgi:hypothetical protein
MFPPFLGREEVTFPGWRFFSHFLKREEATSPEQVDFIIPEKRRSYLP